jgi:hypothetical protein
MQQEEKLGKTKKSLTLKDVPAHIYTQLVEEQARIRKETGKLISLERIIYRLIAGRKVGQ